MKKALSLCLLFMLSLVMISCGDPKSPPGGGAPSASNLAELALFDAKALVLTSTKLYKITTADTLVQVAAEDTQGNTITGKLNFNGLYDVNDDYFLMKLYTTSGGNVRREGFLVSKHDGKTTLLVDLPTEPAEYTTPQDPQMPPVQTDAAGNFYFIEEDNQDLVKLSAGGGKVLSRTILVSDRKTKPHIYWFRVDSAGNILYQTARDLYFRTAAGSTKTCYKMFDGINKPPYSYVLAETGDERGRRFFFQWEIPNTDSAEIYEVTDEEGTNVSTLLYDTVNDIFPDPDMWYLMFTDNSVYREVLYINGHTYLANSSYKTLIEFYNPDDGSDSTPRYVYFDEAAGVSKIGGFSTINFIKQTDSEVLFFGENGADGKIARIEPETETYSENVILNSAINKAIILEDGEIIVTAEVGTEAEPIIGKVQPGAIETIDNKIEVTKMIPL